MVNLLESSKAAVNVRFDSLRGPYQSYVIICQKVTVGAVCVVVVWLQTQTVIWCCLLEAMLFEYPSDQSVLNVGKLVEQPGSFRGLMPKPVGESSARGSLLKLCLAVLIFVIVRQVAPAFPAWFL